MTTQIETITTALGMTNTQRQIVDTLCDVWQGMASAVTDFYDGDGKFVRECNLPVPDEAVSGLIQHGHQMLATPATAMHIATALVMLRGQAKWPTQAIEDRNYYLGGIAEALERKKYPVAVILAALQRAQEQEIFVPTSAHVIPLCDQAQRAIHGAVLYLEQEPRIRWEVAYQRQLVGIDEDQCYSLLRRHAADAAEARRQEAAEEEAEELMDRWDLGAVLRDHQLPSGDQWRRLPKFMRDYVKAHEDGRRHYLDWLPRLPLDKRKEFIADVAYYSVGVRLQGVMNREWFPLLTDQ